MKDQDKDRDDLTKTIPGQSPMPNLEKGRVGDGTITKDSVEDVEADFTAEDEDNKNKDQKNKNDNRTA